MVSLRVHNAFAPLLSLLPFMTPKTVVLVLDQLSFSDLRQGAAPHAEYSHDQNLFQFGHESLRKGYDVYIEVSREARKDTPTVKVASFFPALAFSAVPRVPVAPDFVVVVYPQSLGLRTLYPTSKIIGVLPATLFVENPERPSTRWVHGFLWAARTQIDFYLTQNRRMAELAYSLFRFVARVDLRERILICPLGIVPEQARPMFSREQTRAEMGLRPDDIAFMNAGGPWSWTDYNTCLQAFCNVVREGLPDIKFFVMGFKQAGNFDHERYMAETRAILAANADLVGTSLIVYEDWQDASERIMRYTAAADVGLNPNKDSAENWQSYRLRFLEYVKAGLPVISTEGNDLSDHGAREAVYPVRSGDVKSYEKAIYLAATDHALRRQKAEAMREFSKNLDSRRTYGNVIERLDQMPRRDFDDPKEVFYPVALDVPLLPISEWVERVDAPKDLNRPLLWKSAKEWQDGDTPRLEEIPAIDAERQSFELDFTLTIEAPITASWPEIIQLGRQPESAQLIVCAAAVTATTYRLVLRLFDGERRPLTFVSPDLAVGQTIKCDLCINANDGRLGLRLDRKNYGLQTKPWRGVITNHIWVGSRTLPATIKDVRVRL